MTDANDETEADALVETVPDADSNETESAPASKDEAGAARPGTGAPATVAKPRPGRMGPASGHMSLVTLAGHQLWTGRRASGEGDNEVHAIVGATRFAHHCTGIWRAAAGNDPYADHALIEIEHAWQAAHSAVQTQLRSVTELLETGMPGITFTAKESVKPLVVDLQFSSPWGYRAAHLVKSFDDLAVQALTARSVGLLFDDDWGATVWLPARRIRHTFEQCLLWLHTGVTRDDVAANNETARRAVEAYTERHRNRMLAIDQAVMTGEQRPKLSPRLVQRPGAG